MLTGGAEQAGLGSKRRPFRRTGPAKLLSAEIGEFLAAWVPSEPGGEPGAIHAAFLGENGLPRHSGHSVFLFVIVPILGA